MARIGAAGALVCVLAFLLIFDAVSPDYEVNPVVMVTLVSSMLALLGLEVRDVLRGS